MAKPIPAGQDAFLEQLLQVPGAVVLDFGAAWCGPCRQLELELETLRLEWGERVRVYQVSAAVNANLIARFQVLDLPTLILLIDGQEKARLRGYQPAFRINESFAPFLLPEQNGS